MTQQMDDAVKILSVLHQGYDVRVKNACETAIKALLYIDSLEEEYNTNGDDGEYWRGVKHALDHVTRGNL